MRIIGAAVEGEARNLHPILREEIYRIAAESLRSAFQHAQARKIEVEISYEDEQFRLRVRDDGKGIDPAVPIGWSSTERIRMCEVLALMTSPGSSLRFSGKLS